MYEPLWNADAKYESGVSADECHTFSRYSFMLTTAIHHMAAKSTYNDTTDAEQLEEKLKDKASDKILVFCDYLTCLDIPATTDEGCPRFPRRRRPINASSPIDLQ